MTKIKVWGDFNGLSEDKGETILCLSHSDSCKDEHGNEVMLKEGMELTAFDEDANNDGNRDDLIASGIVERAPNWLQSHGSRWVLRIDENGIRNESEIT